MSNYLELIKLTSQVHSLTNRDEIFSLVQSHVEKMVEGARIALAKLDHENRKILLESCQLPQNQNVEFLADQTIAGRVMAESEPVQIDQASIQDFLDAQKICTVFDRTHLLIVPLEINAAKKAAFYILSNEKAPISDQLIDRVLFLGTLLNDGI
ncbi:MAG: hypothetical protein AAGD96_14505, partial [Chloroflexota bacterium]